MNKLLATTLTAALLATAGAATASAGPSFNCKYAKLPAEVAICDSHHLQHLDKQMAKLYFQSLDWYPHHRHVLKSSQKKWLKSRNACGYNEGCLEAKYEHRIHWLENFAD